MFTKNHETHFPKGRALLAALFLAFCIIGAVVQLIVPTELSAIFAPHLEQCAAITVRQTVDDDILDHQTEDPAEIRKIQDWAAAYTCRAA